MIDQLLRGVRRRRGARLLALCTLSSMATMLFPTAAHAYFNDGVRWLGLTTTCSSLPNWTASSLFTSTSTGGPPTSLANFCLYTWSGPGLPAPGDVATLFNLSGAVQLTEDVPAMSPNALPVTALQDFYTSLRSALRAQVGDASLLPSMPDLPQVRIVVIDSAPTRGAGQIVPGLNRHGDTLAHLIEDIVCRSSPTGDRKCAAEVTTRLALPWIDRSTPGTNGGNMGTPAELASAVFEAVGLWESDKQNSPLTPPRLVLNLSLGWEDTPEIADCSTDPLPHPPASAVRFALQYAASKGALIIAAAGNDSGGPTPRTGLLCPGRYQAMPQDNSTSQALLVAVSGVDYADHPLQTVRPQGITGIVGLGLGGVAWDPNDPAPSPLTGSSVSTAVVSAVSALVWAQRPSWSATEVTWAVYNGGTDLGPLAAPADACPLLMTLCRSHRVSVCGALTAAGASPACSVPPPVPWSCPDLHADVAALTAGFASVVPSPDQTFGPASTIPRYEIPTQQIQPWVFPAPGAVTCRACVATSTQLAIELESGQELTDPVLVAQLQDGSSPQTIQLLAPNMAPLTGATPYVFSLPKDWPAIESAYLTGIVSPGVSITEQVFVQP